jgi:hypothetical protein
VANEGLGGHRDVKDVEGLAEYNLSYGLPGKPGYRYRRPFDFFTFDLPSSCPMPTSVSNRYRERVDPGPPRRRTATTPASTRADCGVSLAAYDYLSPQIFRVSTTALSLGTVVQWWPWRWIALQAPRSAASASAPPAPWPTGPSADYHFGVVPQVVLGTRAIFGDRAMLEVLARGFFVARGLGPGRRRDTSNIGGEFIGRLNAGVQRPPLGTARARHPVRRLDARCAPDGPPRPPSADRDHKPHLQLPGPLPVRRVEWRDDPAAATDRQTPR